MTARRRYCSDKCKSRYHRGARAAVPTGGGQRLAAVPAVEPGPVEAATRADLEEAGQLPTPLGMVAVILAARIDEGDRETGPGLAALAKQLDATLQAVARATVGEATPLDRARDELAVRRARRAP